MKSDILFWLAIFAVYIFQAYVARKKKKAAQQSLPSYGEAPAPMQGAESWERSGPPYSSDSSTEVVTGLESALSEISRMLQGDEPRQAGMPETSQSPDGDFHERLHPSRNPESAVAKTVKSATRLESAKSPFREFRSAGHETGERFYDDSFEKKGREFHAPVITHDHVYDFGGYEKSGGALTPAKKPIPAQPDLTDPQRLREAFIAAEILGKPISKRH
ncbi:MAG: hypothetical protein O2797_01890 [Bacteroidetes bacterium]|nr:hypothetical protein [Bacteroidota bacterium]MDA1332950.1 hypothetical protein [Bacteroidota bacterium]